MLKFENTNFYNFKILQKLTKKEVPYGEKN